MICSTLSGIMSIKHPTLGVLVREDGMVFNCVRGGHGKKCAWTKGYLHKDGYRTVRILGKDYKVHRLLAEAFIPNPENKPTVDHINRIRDDNRLCNLRWATQKEQIENSETVLNRADYGVRRCENIREYRHNRDRVYYKANRDDILTKKRAYYQAHREEKVEYARKRRERKKQDKLAAKESQ